MKDAQAALDVLNTYYSETGRDVTNSVLDSWNITPYLEAFVLVSVEGKNNIAYMVKNRTVIMYSPVYKTDAEIYEAHFVTR